MVQQTTRYGLAVTVPLDYPVAVERTREALGREGFGVLTEIDVSATLKKKLDVDFRPYIILGACNPALAHRALSAERDIGLLLPCNVIVYAGDTAGTSTVAAMDPAAALWGVVTGFCSILPVLGSALVWLPGTLVLVIEQRYGAAGILFVMGAVVASNIDNVIRPIVFKRVSNIHPMVTLVGAFAGVAYFGLLGILLGPLAIQYFFVLLRLYREEYIDKQVTRTMEMRIPHPVTDPTSGPEDAPA